MKRIAFLMIMALMSLTASAGSIRYFTHSQAKRTVGHLNAQTEMMIYCGYDYEIPTYLLVNEVWAERVNSAYYELWVFGYDAYTGEEVYMPLDLECVWLYSAGHIYNAAQYLRFHASVHKPSFGWSIPRYNPYTRISHRPGYRRTYHYEVHTYGWMPPTTTTIIYGGNNVIVNNYYMRQPSAPMPTYSGVWTPGVDRPQPSATDAAGRTSGARPRTGTTTTVPSSSNSRNSGAATTGSRNGSSTSTDARSGSSTTTGARSGNSTTTGARSGNSTSTGARSGSSTTSASREQGASTGARSGSATSATRSTSTTPTRVNTGTSGNTREASATEPASGARTKTATRTDSKESATTTTTGRKSSTSSRTGTTSSRNGSREQTSGTTDNSRQTTTGARTGNRSRR